MMFCEWHSQGYDQIHPCYVASIFGKFSKQSCMNNIWFWMMSSSKNLILFKELTMFTNLVGIYNPETFVPMQPMC